MMNTLEGIPDHAIAIGDQMVKEQLNLSLPFLAQSDCKRIASLAHQAAENIEDPAEKLRALTISAFWSQVAEAIQIKHIDK